jgi:hypothetical protein
MHAFGEILELLLSVLYFSLQPDHRHLETPSTAPATLTSPPACPFCLDRTNVAGMFSEHPCRPWDWEGSHSPRSLASGLPCDPSSLPRQEIALRLFLPVSPDRALINVLPSNTWRARSRRLASETTNLPRAKPLARDHDSPSYTSWRGTSHSICPLPPGHSHRTPQPIHRHHVWQDTGTV